jgi:hypothetical protein
MLGRPIQKVSLKPIEQQSSMPSLASEKTLHPMNPLNALTHPNQYENQQKFSRYHHKKKSSHHKIDRTRSQTN